VALTQYEIDHLADAAIESFNTLEDTMRGKAGSALIRLTSADAETLKNELALVSRGSRREIERTITATIQRAAEASLAKDEATYAAARAAGLIAPYAPVGESAALNELLSKGIATAQNMANIVRTKAEQAVLADFIDALDSAMLAVAVPDGIGIEAATRQAIASVIQKTPTVTYAQADGSTMNQGLYGAVRRAVQTGANQTTARLTLARAEELGVATFEVSAHMGARPDHAEWQGGVYTLEELETVCEYGDVVGLCGANCRHTFYPFISGVMEPTDWSEMDDPTGEAYELSQRQRACERAIRGYKGREAAYSQVVKDSGDPQVKAWAEDQQLKANGLKRKWQDEADRVAGLRGGVRRGAREVGALAQTPPVKIPTFAPPAPVIPPAPPAASAPAPAPAPVPAFVAPGSTLPPIDETISTQKLIGRLKGQGVDIKGLSSLTPEAARDIARGIERELAAGTTIPPITVKKAAAKFAAAPAYASTTIVNGQATSTITINTACRSTLDVASRERMVSTGWWAGDSTLGSLISHELGHVEHYESFVPTGVPIGFARHNIGIPKLVGMGGTLNPKWTEIEGKVSTYAMTNGTEFVSEVRAGIMAGKTYDAEVWEIFYKAWGSGKRPSWIK